MIEYTIVWKNDDLPWVRSWIPSYFLIYSSQIQTQQAQPTNKIKGTNYSRKIFSPPPLPSKYAIEPLGTIVNRVGNI